MNAERLLKLAAFLDTLPPAKFDYNQVAVENGLPMLDALAKGNHRCGTVGCAIGWAPAAFPGELEWKKPDHLAVWQAANARTVKIKDAPIESDTTLLEDSFHTAEIFFDLSTDEAQYLFMPDNGYIGSLDRCASPVVVAEHIRDFVERKTAGTFELEPEREADHDFDRYAD